jgi:hypothetical protein
MTTAQDGGKVKHVVENNNNNNKETYNVRVLCLCGLDGQ